MPGPPGDTIRCPLPAVIPDLSLLARYTILHSSRCIAARPLYNISPIARRDTQPLATCRYTILAR